MGRAENHGANEIYKFRLYRVYLDTGGYDDGGAYWGIGNPLYCYESTDGSVYAYGRATSRAEAKEKVLSQYPKGSFFR